MVGQHRLERGVGQLAGSHDPHDGMLLDLLQQMLLAGDDAALGASQHFVTGKTNQIRACGQGVFGRGLVYGKASDSAYEVSGAEIGDEERILSEGLPKVSYRRK